MIDDYMADATQQQKLSNSNPLIVDTHLRYSYMKMLVAIFMGGILLIILMKNIRFTLPMFSYPYLIGLFIGSCVSIPISILRKWIIIPRTKTHINKHLSKIEKIPIEEKIVNLLSSFKPIGVYTYLQEFAKILIERGHYDVTIRSCPPKDIVAIHPFNVTFEPLLLDEADETIAELENSLNTDDTRDDTDAHTGENLATGIIPPRIKRNIRIAGGWGIFIFLFICALFLVILSFITGQGVIIAAIIPLCLFMIISGNRPGSTLGRRKWLIVPGGLIVREGKFFSQDCQLHLFSRRTSVLIVRKISKHQWSLIAANENTFQYAVVTRKESELLLRAWLSPLTPPPIEQLSDLM